MPSLEWFLLMGMGVIFVVAGIIFLVNGNRGAEMYYQSYADSPDVRKFMERSPRPKYESLKIGGRVAIVLGIIMLAIGGAIWFW
jgi:hypothetical protein